MKAQLKIVVYILIGLCLADVVISKGASGGGGGGGGGGGRGGGGGSRGGRAGSSRFIRGAVFARSVKSGNTKSEDGSVREDKATGAVLIPEASGNRVYPIYKSAEVHSYYQREGIGMSAWGIIALVLAVVGGGTLAWFCYTVGLPMWKERQRRHSLISNSQLPRPHEGIPLQETPSTATPSPCLAVCLPS